MPANRVVYAIGDSQIGHENGHYDPLSDLRELLGHGAYFKAQGVMAETSPQVLARLGRDVIDRIPRPDTCIVMAGVNDIQMGSPASAIIANLEAMYRLLLDAGIRPIALTIFPFGGYIHWSSSREAVRLEVRAWMHDELPTRLPDVEVVDVEDVIGDLSDKGRPRIRAEYAEASGLHLNHAGGAAAARALFDRSPSLGGSQG